MGALKQIRRKVVTTFLMTLLFSPLMPAMAVPLNQKQHNELFVKGTITDENGKTWKIAFIPGSEEIYDLSYDSWKYSYDNMGEYFKVETIKSEVKKPFIDGLKIIKDAFWEDGYVDLKEKFTKVVEENTNLDKNAFGYNFTLFTNWLRYFGYSVGVSLRTLLVSVYGVSYTVVRPALGITARPILSTLSAIFPGTLFPSVVYIWNGTAWVATYYSHVPTVENRWVYIKGSFNDSPEVKEFKIDAEGFKSIVLGSIIKSLSNDQLNDIKNRKEEISEKIEALRKQYNELSNEGHAIEESLYSNSYYTYMKNILNQALNATTATTSNDVKNVVFNEELLNKMIRDSLKTLEVSELKDSQVDAIKLVILENLKNFNLNSSSSSNEAPIEVVTALN